MQWQTKPNLPWEPALSPPSPHSRVKLSRPPSQTWCVSHHVRMQQSILWQNDHSKSSLSSQSLTSRTGGPPLSSLTSQIQTVLSSDPETTCVPSCENATDNMSSEWPLCTHFYVSHLCIPNSDWVVPQTRCHMYPILWKCSIGHCMNDPWVQVLPIHRSIPNLDQGIHWARSDACSIMWECNRWYPTQMTLWYILYLICCCIPYTHCGVIWPRARLAQNVSSTPLRIALIKDSYSLWRTLLKHIENNDPVNLDILVNDAFDKVYNERVELLRMRVEIGHVRIAHQNLVYCWLYLRVWLRNHGGDDMLASRNADRERERERERERDQL